MPVTYNLCYVYSMECYTVEPFTSNSGRIASKAPLHLRYKIYVHWHICIMPESVACLPVDWLNGKLPAPSTLIHCYHWLSDKQ